MLMSSGDEIETGRSRGESDASKDVSTRLTPQSSSANPTRTETMLISQSMQEWEPLWVASKQLDSNRVRKYLMPTMNLHNHSNSKKKGLEGCNNACDYLLFPHSDASMALHQYIFGHQPSTHDKSNAATDALLAKINNNACSNLSQVEKKMLGFRSLLLLPPYAVAPWDAMKSFLKLLIEDKAMTLSSFGDGCGKGGIDTHHPGVDVVTRKCMGDVRVYISCIFKGYDIKSDASRDKNIITFESQRSELMHLWNIVVDHLYSARERDVSDKLFHERQNMVFQLIAPIYKACLRLHNWSLNISEGKRLNYRGPSTDKNTLVDSLLGYHKQQKTSKSNHMIPSNISPLIKVLSNDLRDQFCQEHWSLLQRIIFQSITVQKSIDTSTASDIIGSIMTHIVASQKKQDESDRHVFVQWVEIILLTYYISSFRTDSVPISNLNLHLFNTLPNLQKDTTPEFLQIVAGVHSSFLTICSDRRDAFIPGDANVPSWTRAYILLLSFQSRQHLPSAYSYLNKLMGTIDIAPNEQNNHATVMDDLLALVRNVVKNDPYFQKDDWCRNGRGDLCETSIATLKQIMSRNGFDQEENNVFSISRTSDLISIFQVTTFLVKYTTKEIKTRGDELPVLNPYSLWKILARHSFGNMIAIDNNTVGEVVLAGAIFLNLVELDSSFGEQMIRDIRDYIYESCYGSSFSTGGSLAYSWLLQVMATRPCQSGSDASIWAKPNKLRFIYSPLYELVQQDGTLFPRNTTEELIRSLTLIPKGRKVLAKYFLKAIQSKSLKDQIVPRVQHGIDGIMLLLQSNLCIKSKVDEALLLVLNFVSDEVVTMRSISTESGRLKFLVGLRSVCEQQQRVDAVTERILAATLVRLLPHFRFKTDSSDEIDFMPNYLMCVSGEENTLLQEEIILLTSLVLIPMRSEPGLSAAPLDLLSFLGDILGNASLVSTTNDMPNVLRNQASSYQIALMIIKSLVRHLLNPREVSDTTTRTDPKLRKSRGGQLLLDEYFEPICRQEVEFWTELAIRNVGIPKWVNSSLQDNRPRFSDAVQLPHELSSALCAVLIQNIFATSYYNASASSKDINFEHSFNISFAANSVLHALWTRRTNDERSLWHLTSSDYECSIIKDFFASTSDTLGYIKMTYNEKYKRHSDYLKLVLPATLEICNQFNAVLLSPCKVEISKIYQSLVKFFCTACECHTMPYILNSGASEELKAAALSCVKKLTDICSSPNVLENKQKMHLTLLHRLCNELYSSLKEIGAGRDSSHSASYTNTIAEVVIWLVQLLKTDYNIGSKKSKIDGEEIVRSSSGMLWKTLKDYVPQNHKLFKKLFSVCISEMPELLRITHSKRSLDSELAVARETSYSVLALDIMAKNLAIRESNDQGSNPLQYSWLSKNSSRSEEWALLICLDFFKSTWVAFYELFSRNKSITTSPISGERALSGGLAGKHTRLSLTDLSSTLTSVILLQTKCTRLLSHATIQKILFCVEQVITTLSSAASYILRTLKALKTTRNAKDLKNITDTISLEAYKCLVSWLETYPSETDDASDFISISKVWCELVGKRKQHANRSSKIIRHILDFEDLITKFSKKLNKTEGSAVIEGFTKHFPPKGMQRNINLVGKIDEYISKAGITSSLPSSNTRSRRDSSKPQKVPKNEKNNKGRKALSSAKSDRKKRHRNSVVNDWLELDRELDGKNSNDIYEDLEDFILPG